MVNGIITYLIIGVVFNFVFDLLVNFSGNEEQRFTTVERLIMTLVWPVGVLAFVFYFIKNLID